MSDRVLRQITDFARENAPGAAVGVIDREGRRYFEGDGIVELNREPDAARKRPAASPRRVSPFTDINQWLLKVLLAPWLPPHLTAAPRGEYRNATELARAAKVSVMSAFRLIEALRADGHLEEAVGTLRVVRRRDLLERWCAWSAAQACREIPAVFLVPGDPRLQLRSIFDREVGVCLALFAAADAVSLGFVRGVAPHVYLPGLTGVAIRHLGDVAEAAAGERPSLFLRQAPAIQSVFRAAVRTPDGLATDVLQTWLDVSAHPARGREQADRIERQVLGPLFEDE